MYRSRLASILLGPSLLSASVSVILAGGIVGATFWSYSAAGGGLHQYLFGPYGLTTVFQHSANALSAVNGVFSSPVAYDVAVAVFALFIGLLVFVFLEGADHVSAKAAGALNEVNYITNARIKKQVEKQAEIRLGLRLATLVVWICYLVFFARVIVPFAILIARDDHGAMWSIRNFWSACLSGLVLFIALHVHVILMRLLVLRPRLFGGEDVIISRGEH